MKHIFKLILPLLLSTSVYGQINVQKHIDSLYSDGRTKQAKLEALRSESDVKENSIGSLTRRADSLDKMIAINKATIIDLNKKLAQTLTEPPIFGVNAHYLNTTEYADTKKVTDVAQASGFKAIRTALFTDATGALSGETKFKEVVYQLFGRGIEVYATVNTTGFDVNSKDSAAQYNIAYQVGLNTAIRWSRYVKAFEMGNEMDNKSIISGSGDGSKVVHYDQAKLRMTLIYLKGMYDGLRAGSKNTPLILDAGWLHFAFIAEARKRGINFDILGWHWYYKMEKNKPEAIGSLLTKNFPSLPVIYNEVGYNNTTGNEADAAPYILRLLRNSKGVFLYELIDQYTRTNPDENHLGLFDRNWKAKPLIVALKAAI